MASILKVQHWWNGLDFKRRQELGLYKIYDIIAVRVVQELVGKSAPKNEPNWPTARINSVVGSFCMRYNIGFAEMVRYVALVHERKQPITEVDNFALGLGEALVQDYVRNNSAGLFTQEGRRKLHSMAREVGLSSADLFGALGVLLHDLSDELATCCGGPNAVG